MSGNRIHIFTVSLFAITLFSGFFLALPFSFADDSAQDNVSVNVPVSCTMDGTGMNSHNATIPNGTYQADIGTTTLKAFCNDSAGFAVYAIGYTNEEYGNTNLVGANQGQNIVTGTATTAGNPDISNWAVKLATNSGATYPLTLDNSFGNYHNIPTTYTKVAHRDSGTDLGSSATGSTLTTTYAAYISKTQAADTYNGKVKYTLVHPANAPAPKPRVSKTLELVYDAGSRLYFDSDKTQKQNIVTYEASCEYENKQFDIVKTSNLDDSGIQSDPYNVENFERVFSYPEANKLKVVVKYGITANTAGITVAGENEESHIIFSEENNLSGTETYILNSNNVNIHFETWDTENLVNDYNYGFYVTIYPLDQNDNEIEFTTFSDCEWVPVNGTYKEPMFDGTYWFERWVHKYGTGYSEEQVLDKLKNYHGENSITISAQAAV